MLSMSKGRQADTDGQTLNFIFSFYVWIWKRSPNSHENVNTELPSDSKCKRFRPWAGVKDKVNFENERGRERHMPRTIRVHFIKCCSFLFRNSWSVPIKLLSNEFSGRLIELPGTTSNMCQAKVYQWFDICPTKKSNQHHFWRNTHQSFARKLQPRTTTNVCCLYDFHTRMIRMCNGFKPCIATAGANRTFVNNRFAIKCEFHRFLLSYFTFKWQWYDLSKSFLNSNHFYWIEKGNSLLLQLSFP